MKNNIPLVPSLGGGANNKVQPRGATFVDCVFIGPSREPEAGKTKIPVTCPHCGLIFNLPGVVLEGVKVITLEGNTQQCPRCGKMAEVMNGVFEVVDGVLKAIKDLKDNPQSLAVIQDKAQAFKAGKVTWDDFVQAVETVNKPLAYLMKSKNKKLIIPLVFVLLVLFKLGSKAADWSVDKAIDYFNSRPAAVEEVRFFPDDEARLRQEYERESEK